MTVLETDKHSQQGLLIDAAKARHEADRYHRASLLAHDSMVEATLMARETELLRLAENLEAQAAKLTPV